MSLEEQRSVVLAAEPEAGADLIYLASDTEGLVRSIPELSFHRIVQAKGKWQVQELIEVATEEQINFMLDHDCWNVEKLDSRRFCDWISLFLDADDEHVLRLLTSISADTLAFALKKHVRFDRDIMVNDVYYCDPAWVTATNAPMRMFLERLYALDPNLWIRLMGWIRTHSKPTIEADAVEAHESRMRGKGFPAPTLAITIYYPVEFDVQGLITGWQTDFRQLGAGEATQQISVYHERRELFMKRVFGMLARNSDNGTPSLQRIEASLAEIANKVMIADQVDIGDRKRQREALDKVRRWINIGLELVCARDVDTSLHMIKDTGLEYFFRVSAMLFDALSTAVVELTKSEQRAGGRLSMSELANCYFPLLEPEPHIPCHKGGSTGQAIATAAGYRYAWQLIWAFEDMLAD